MGKGDTRIQGLAVGLAATRVSVGGQEGSGTTPSNQGHRGTVMQEEALRINRASGEALWADRDEGCWDSRGSAVSSARSTGVGVLRLRGCATLSKWPHLSDALRFRLNEQGYDRQCSLSGLFGSSRG